MKKQNAVTLSFDLDKYRQWVLDRLRRRGIEVDSVDFGSPSTDPIIEKHAVEGARIGRDVNETCDIIQNDVSDFVD